MKFVIPENPVLDEEGNLKPGWSIDEENKNFQTQNFIINGDGKSIEKVFYSDIPEYRAVSLYGRNCFTLPGWTTYKATFHPKEYLSQDGTHPKDFQFFYDGDRDVIHAGCLVVPEESGVEPGTFESDYWWPRHLNFRTEEEYQAAQLNYYNKSIYPHMQRSIDTWIRRYGSPSKETLDDLNVFMCIGDGISEAHQIVDISQYSSVGDLSEEAYLIFSCLSGRNDGQQGDDKYSGRANWNSIDLEYLDENDEIIDVYYSTRNEPDSLTPAKTFSTPILDEELTKVFVSRKLDSRIKKVKIVIRGSMHYGRVCDVFFRDIKLKIKIRKDIPFSFDDSDWVYNYDQKSWLRLFFVNEEEEKKVLFVKGGKELVGIDGADPVRDKYTFVQYGRAGTWKQTAHNINSIFGINEDNELYAWGNNYYGQLGIGNFENKSTPEKIDGLWKYITGGNEPPINNPTYPNDYKPITVGIKDNGTLWYWGRTTFTEVDYTADLTSSIINPSAENGDMTGWITPSDVGDNEINVETVQTQSTVLYGVSTAKQGDYYFYSGNNVISQYSSAHQDIDVSSYSAKIDDEKASVDLSWWQNTYAGFDEGKVDIVFLNASNVELYTESGTYENPYTGGQYISPTAPYPYGKGSWQPYFNSSSVPVGTRKIRIKMKSKVNAGNNNDSCFDNFEMTIILYKEISVNSPKQLETANNWVKVAVGHQFISALNTDKEIWVIGKNNYGQLGLGHNVFRTKLEKLPNNWIDVDSCSATTLAINDFDGLVYGWGRNNKYQLGLNDTTNRSSPTLISIADFNQDIGDELNDPKWRVSTRKQLDPTNSDVEGFAKFPDFFHERNANILQNASQFEYAVNCDDLIKNKDGLDDVHNPGNPAPLHPMAGWLNVLTSTPNQAFMGNTLKSYDNYDAVGTQLSTFYPDSNYPDLYPTEITPRGDVTIIGESGPEVVGQYDKIPGRWERFNEGGANGGMADLKWRSEYESGSVPTANLIEPFPREFLSGKPDSGFFADWLYGERYFFNYLYGAYNDSRSPSAIRQIVDVSQFSNYIDVEKNISKTSPAYFIFNYQDGRFIHRDTNGYRGSERDYDAERNALIPEIICLDENKNPIYYPGQKTITGANFVGSWWQSNWDGRTQYAGQRRMSNSWEMKLHTNFVDSTGGINIGESTNYDFGSWAPYQYPNNYNQYVYPFYPYRPQRYLSYASYRGLYKIENITHSTWKFGRWGRTWYKAIKVDLQNSAYVRGIGVTGGSDLGYGISESRSYDPVRYGADRVLITGTQYYDGIWSVMATNPNNDRQFYLDNRYDAHSNLPTESPNSQGTARMAVLQNNGGWFCRTDRSILVNTAPGTRYLDIRFYMQQKRSYYKDVRANDVQSNGRFFGKFGLNFISTKKMLKTENFTQVSISDDSSYALSKDNQLYGWGGGTYGLGYKKVGVGETQKTPTKIGDGFLQVKTYKNGVTYGIKTSKELYGWGYNGPQTSGFFPYVIQGQDKFAELDANGSFLKPIKLSPRTFAKLPEGTAYFGESDKTVYAILAGRTDEETTYHNSNYDKYKGFTNLEDVNIFGGILNDIEIKEPKEGDYLVYSNGVWKNMPKQKPELIFSYGLDYSDYAYNGFPIGNDGLYSGSILVNLADLHKWIDWTHPNGNTYGPRYLIGQNGIYVIGKNKIVTGSPYHNYLSDPGIFFNNLFEDSNGNWGEVHMGGRFWDNPFYPEYMSDGGPVYRWQNNPGTAKPEGEFGFKYRNPFTDIVFDSGKGYHVYKRWAYFAGRSNGTMQGEYKVIGVARGAAYVHESGRTNYNTEFLAVDNDKTFGYEYRANTGREFRPKKDPTSWNMVSTGRQAKPFFTFYLQELFSKDQVEFMWKDELGGLGGIQAVFRGRDSYLWFPNPKRKSTVFRMSKKYFEHFNTPNSGYDPTTGLFTAPVTGLYEFQFGIFIKNMQNLICDIFAVVEGKEICVNKTYYRNTVQDGDQIPYPATILNGYWANSQGKGEAPCIGSWQGRLNKGDTFGFRFRLWAISLKNDADYSWSDIGVVNGTYEIQHGINDNFSLYGLRDDGGLASPNVAGDNFIYGRLIG